MYNAQDIVNTIKTAKKNGYRFFGIRSISNEAGTLNVGDRCPDSYDWDMENDCSTFCTTGDTLNGACAVRIALADLFLDGDDDDEAAEAVEKAVEASSVYYGDEVMLIGSKDGCEDGWDQDEVILEDADVLAIL